MNAHDVERLRQFFAGYFHEDWAIEDADPAAIIDLYLASHANAADLRLLSDNITAYVDAHQADVDLEDRLFRELGCYYVPSADGLSARAWLRNVSSVLRARAERT